MTLPARQRPNVDGSGGFGRLLLGHRKGLCLTRLPLKRDRAITTCNRSPGREHATIRFAIRA